MPLFVVSPCCLTSFPGDTFLAADSSFGVFEEIVKTDCHKDCAPISLNDKASPVNNNVPYLSLSDMTIPREKAEALLPILLVSCLRLNSSSDVVHEHKSILAPILAAAYFFNRAKLFPFPIQSGRNKRGNLTPKAMAHLHGKRLMDLLTPCEEAFIRFVVLLDIMRYHSYSLMPSVSKYHMLFSGEDRDTVIEFIDTYTNNGVEKIRDPLNYRTPFKPFKGYRTKDILLFMIVKKQVLAERNNLKTVVSPDIDLPYANPPTTGVIPFTFSFPESIACIKLEPGDYDSNKKRKLVQDGAASHTSMAMEFDDGGMCFDYNNAAKINAHGV